MTEPTLPDLPDSALALLDNMNIDLRSLDDWDGNHAMMLRGAYELARVAHQILTDIANNFAAERPEQAAASSVLAVGGLIHDIHLIAQHAGMVDPDVDIPPNPLQAALEHAPRNREERRREERLSRRLHGGRKDTP